MQTERTINPRSPHLFFIFLLSLPIFLSLYWYDALAETAYHQLQIADFLARGQTAISEHTSPPTSPLFLLFAIVLHRLMLPSPLLAALLSGLGWGLAAVGLFRLGRVWQRPLAGAAAAALLAFNPLIIQTTGTEWSWLLALALFSLLFTHQHKWWQQSTLLLLLLAAHFSRLTLLWVMLLWGWRWHKTGQLPWPSDLGFLLFSFFWSGLMIRYWGPAAFWQSQLPNSRLVYIFSTFTPGTVNEFYWLALPLFLLGLWTLPRKVLVTLLGSLLLILVAVEPLAAQMIIVTAALFVSGLGLDWIYRRVSDTYETTLSDTAVLLIVIFIAGLPLIASQGYRLWQMDQVKPTHRLALEKEAGQWLQANSPSTATLYSTARLAYLAHRRQTAPQTILNDVQSLPQFWAALQPNPPQYFVVPDSLSWQLFQESGWFLERYQPAHHLASNQVADLTIWQRRSGATDDLSWQPLAWQTTAGFDIVGSKISPQRPQTDEPIHLSLQLQAGRPMSEPVRAVLQLTNFPDGTVLREVETIRPSTIPLSWWQPGQIIEEQFALQPGELPVGAYALNIAWLGQDDMSFPQTTANSDASFTAVPVGTLAVTESEPAVNATAVQATFADQIQLISQKIDGIVSPGETLTIQLHFTALRPPDNDYTIFVHLLNDANDLIAGDDHKPLAGRFPTQTWLPGDVVSSRHTLILPPDLAAGRYRLNLGFYLLETGERLPVTNADGQAQADDTFTLSETTIP